MRGSRMFCQSGSNFDNLFFSWWGGRGSKYHISRPLIGPPAKRHLNGVSLVGRWWPNIECWLGSFDFSGDPDQYFKMPYIFVIFQGGSGPPVPMSPSGSAHAYTLLEITCRGSIVELNKPAHGTLVLIILPSNRGLGKFVQKRKLARAIVARINKVQWLIFRQKMKKPLALVNMSACDISS